MLNVQIKLIQTIRIHQQNGTINVIDVDAETIVSRRVETLGDAETIVSDCLVEHAAKPTQRIEATIVLPTDDDPRTFALAEPFADWQTYDDEDNDNPVQWLWRVRWPFDSCTVATR